MNLRESAALWPVAAVLAAIAIFGTKATPTQALPTFAKAYGVECSLCHSVPPQLNAYGRYIQRTGYSALSRDVLKNVLPVNVAEEVTYDSQGSHQVEPGNLALHAVGYLSPDITYHIHQWIVQNSQAGGLDTFQLAYNRLFNGNGHFFVGKLSALPVPAPFSNQSDIAKYASAELTVGEHMYTFDMMRWGTALSYVHANLYVQAGWFDSSADWNGATDFSNNTDKTFQWIAAYADPNRPLEAGAFGSIGSYPLAEGGVDPYHTLGLYVQRDPGPRFMPGVFALYQWGHDANPGSMMMSGSMAPTPFGPADSTAETFELYEPILGERGLVGLRQETTDDGLGNVSRSGDIDLSFMPFAHYDYLHLFLENALIQNSRPAWRGGLWWVAPL
ncbi:MAG: hypothetical protein ACYDCA_11700 [Candidatus Tyrphobacter sp.]